MSLEERIERLEGQNRRLRAAVIVSGACLALIIGMAAANQVVRGGLFIENVEGRLQTAIETHTEFGPAIRIIDQNGSERLRIGSSFGEGGEPFIEFYGQGPAPNQRGPRIKRITSRD